MVTLTNTVAGLTLALLTSLAGLFSDGVAQFRAEKYDQAQATFTKVLEAQDGRNPFVEPALLFRARCLAKQDKKDLALKDLERLLGDYASSSLREAAAAEYAALAGKPWAGIDLSTPEAAWKTLMRGAAERDIEMVKASVTGEMAGEFVDHMERRADALDEWAQELGRVTLGEIVYNKTKDRAVAAMTMNRGSQDHLELLLFVRGPQGWQLSGQPRGEERDAFRTAMAAEGKIGPWAWQEDRNRLRQLHAATEQYTMEYERSPAKLEDASEYIRDFASTSISAVDGKPFVLAYPGGASPARGTSAQWIYLSSPVDGKRQCCIGGSVQVLDEKTFRARAAEAKVRVPADWKDVKTSPEQAERIGKLIAQLGAPRAGDRRSAREELKAIGAPAGPLLEKATHSEDPEVAATARELLLEL